MVGTRVASRGTITRHADLAHHVVGARHHRDRGDVGVRGEHAFDLDRVHVVAAAHVHLLAPADEAEPAAVVDPAEIPGAHESVGGERGRGLFFVVPVARHHGGRAQADLADLAGGHGVVVGVEEVELDAGVRPADADHGVLVGIVERGAEPDPRFGARVARRERGAEAPAGFFGQAGSDRPAARDDESDAGEIE